MKIRIIPLILCFVAPLASAAMVSMDDSEMASEIGQALFNSDKIPGVLGSGQTFYRVGMDVSLDFNLNIDKLKLGCGGSNDSLAAGCDIDIDFLQLMGLSGTSPGAAATSTFNMLRPYIDIAIKNDGTAATREVVGVKFGAQSVNGLMGIGRQYTAGQTNIENGGSCGGGNDINCHSGINSFSGSMARILMSGHSNVTTPIGNAEACFGQMAGTPCSGDANFVASALGTRLSSVLIPDIPLRLYNAGGVLAATCLGGCPAGNADINEGMRMIHQIALTNTPDFFFSFQRERVRYPGLPSAGVYTYAPAANTGWWMNLPEIKILNTQSTAALNLFGASGVFAALAEGANLSNLDLGLAPPDNCFGSNTFC